MSLVVSMLFKCRDMALSAWPFPIQPNSLIAALTTISKTAMIISITSCISQLKWQYFRREPRELDLVQILDGASRGPWGALLLLYQNRTRNWLICWLAAVMVAAIGIETSAQQVFEYPTRNTELMLNETSIPRIWLAESYQESMEDLCGNEYTQYDGESSPSRLQLALSSLTISNSRYTWPARCLRERGLLEISIGNAIGGVEAKPSFQCPPQAKYCTFPAFTSLAMCGKVENYTDAVTVSCNTNANRSSVCSYQWDDLNAARLGISNETVRTIEMDFNSQSIETSGNLSYTITRHDQMKTLSIYPLSDGRGLGLAFLRKQDSSGYYGYGFYPKVELLGVYWEWCVQTFTSTNATSSGIAAATAMEEILTGPVDQTANDDIRKYTANSTGMSVRISATTDWLLGSAMHTALGAQIRAGTVTWNDSTGPQPIPMSEASSLAGMIGLYLSIADIENVAKSVAATISAFIRTPDDTNNMRANRNATFMTGKAFAEETYIRVRWQWLIFPLMETLLTAALLVVTIILDRRSGYPLLKASALGLLFHGLEGWVPGDLKDHKAAVETAEGLEGVAMDIRVRFISDEAGKLRFVRCD